MCNCGNISICTQCSAGQPCNCPPDYSVTAIPVACGCCPDGYTFYPATANYPNGYCCLGGDGQGANCVAVTTPIPCNTCAESVSSDCVFATDVPCMGITQATSLTAILQYLCSDAFTFKMLQNIGLSTTLKAAFCQITAVCPTVGSTVPVPGPIIVTIP